MDAGLIFPPEPNYCIEYRQVPASVMLGNSPQLGAPVRQKREHMDSLDPGHNKKVSKREQRIQQDMHDRLKQSAADRREMYERLGLGHEATHMTEEQWRNAVDQTVKNAVGNTAKPVYTRGQLYSSSTAYTSAYGSAAHNSAYATYTAYTNAPMQIYPRPTTVTSQTYQYISTQYMTTSMHPSVWNDATLYGYMSDYKRQHSMYIIEEDFL